MEKYLEMLTINGVTVVTPSKIIEYDGEQIVIPEKRFAYDKSDEMMSLLEKNESDEVIDVIYKMWGVTRNNQEEI